MTRVLWVLWDKHQFYSRFHLFLFRGMNAFEDHHDRIVLGVTISEETNIAWAYQGGPRAVNGESIPAPDLRKHLCSFRGDFCPRARVLPGWVRYRQCCL